MFKLSLIRNTAAAQGGEAGSRRVITLLIHIAAKVWVPLRNGASVMLGASKEWLKQLPHCFFCTLRDKIRCGWTEHSRVRNLERGIQPRGEAGWALPYRQLSVLVSSRRLQAVFDLQALHLHPEPCQLQRKASASASRHCVRSPAPARQRCSFSSLRV